MNLLLILHQQDFDWCTKFNFVLKIHLDFRKGVTLLCITTEYMLLFIFNFIKYLRMMRNLI